MEQINWNNYIVKIEHILQNKLVMLYTEFFWDVKIRCGNNKRILLFNSAKWWFRKSDAVAINIYFYLIVPIWAPKIRCGVD